MGGGIPIKVVNCPSQDLALTNYAFVNYSDAGTYVLDTADPERKGFVEISGIVLSVRYPSTCSVNLCQTSIAPLCLLISDICLLFDFVLLRCFEKILVLKILRKWCSVALFFE